MSLLSIFADIGPIECRFDPLKFFSPFLQGLKTGMYYLRTKAAAQAIQFTVDKSKLKQRTSISSASTPTAKSQKEDDTNMAAMMCSLQNREACDMCSA